MRSRKLSNRWIGLLVSSSLAGALLAQVGDDEAMGETLASTGTLRAAFLGANPVQVSVNPQTREISGPAVDVARELARRMGVPVTIQPLSGVPAVMDAVENGSADIGFIAYDTTRAERVAFTQAYIYGHNSYIVRADSPLDTFADADSEGVRIAAISGNAVDLHLNRTLGNAELVHLARGTADVEAARMLLAGEIDAYAANKQRLAAVAASEPGVRVLDGSVLPVEQSIVVAQHNEVILSQLNRLIDEARDSGLLQEIVERYMISGVEVAPKGERSLPNPYQSILNWAELPQGRTWGQMAALGIDSRGNVWAVERCGGTTCDGRPEAPVLAFGPSGDVVNSLGEGVFVFPHGIAIDDDDNLWVTDGRGVDGKGHQVIKFNPEGEIVMRLGTAGVAGEDPDTFNGAAAVAIAPNGDIFVGDGHGTGTNARVVKFSNDGTFITAWGRRGSGPGEFSTPHALAFDSTGRLFVADRENNRIQIFTQDGVFLEEWTQFGRPSGIWIDSSDVIYVADAHSNMALNPGFSRGLRTGSARDGSVTAFIPHPNPDPASPAAEAVVTDAAGNLYTAGNDEPVAKHSPTRR